MVPKEISLSKWVGDSTSSLSPALDITWIRDSEDSVDRLSTGQDYVRHFPICSHREVIEHWCQFEVTIWNLITYQVHVARTTTRIAPRGACSDRRIGPNRWHDVMSVVQIRFRRQCGAWIYIGLPSSYFGAPWLTVSSVKVFPRTIKRPQFRDIAIRHSPHLMKFFGAVVVHLVTLCLLDFHP